MKKGIIISTITLVILFIILFLYDYHRHKVRQDPEAFLKKHHLTVVKIYEGKEKYKVISEYLKDPKIVELNDRCPTDTELKQLFDLNKLLKIEDCSLIFKYNGLDGAVLDSIFEIYGKCKEHNISIITHMNDIYDSIPDDSNDKCMPLVSIRIDIDRSRTYELLTDNYWQKVSESKQYWESFMRRYSEAVSDEEEVQLKKMLQRKDLDPRKKDDILLCLQNMERSRRNEPIIDGPWKYKYVRPK